MRRLATVALSLAGIASLLVVSAPTAYANPCFGIAEWDQLEVGMSRTQVFNLSELYGDYVGDTPDGDEFKVKYRPLCWTDDYKGILWYGYADSRLNDWAVREIG